MKALFITDIGYPEKDTIGKMELREIPVPEPNDEEILVRVAYSSICGSDIHTLRGSLGDRTPRLRASLPRRVGHEVSGVIEKVGATAEKNGFKVGDRVTGDYMQKCGACHYCRTGKNNYCQHPMPRMNAMSEYICWHMSQVYKIPDAVSLKVAALTEPVTVGFCAVETSKVQLGSQLAIFGGGGIGQIALQIGALAGASNIVLIEPVQEKRELALRLGADHAIDPTKEDIVARSQELTNGLGFDSVIEASGASSAAKSALDILGVDGNVVYFSMYNPTYDLPVNLFNNMYFQQKHIHGMWNSVDLFPRVLALLPKLNLDALTQKEYALSDYEKAFEDQISGKYPKILFKCSDAQ